MSKNRAVSLLVDAFIMPRFSNYYGVQQLIHLLISHTHTHYDVQLKPFGMLRDYLDWR